MAETIWRFSPLILFPLTLLAARWVWQDAKRLKEKGANLTPELWGILVFVIWLVALPSYLILRRTTWRREIDPSLPPSRLHAFPFLDPLLALSWLLLSFYSSGSRRIAFLLLFLGEVFVGFMKWRRTRAAEKGAT
jgi:hypothetical protein